MMSANWVSVKIMVPSECRPTGFLPTARPPYIDYYKAQIGRFMNSYIVKSAD